jgi:hypothetical protein
MINYFRKILTGYTIVKKNINGVDCRFSYSGKPVFFDPVLMLKEYCNRIAEDSVQHLSLQVSSQDILSIFPNPSAEALPTVICNCVKNGQELRVSRFTSKEGAHPLSFYLFEINGMVVASFRRKYDYGSQLKEVGEKLAMANQSSLDLSKEKWLWSRGQHEKLLLEKFGHTQVWHISDFQKLEFFNLP